MSHVIRVFGLAGGPEPEAGKDWWLKSWDLDARGGLGTFELTDDVGEAHRFPDAMAAIRAWREQSRTHPTRASDGQPNRPLTALTITVEKV